MSATRRDRVAASCRSDGDRQAPRRRTTYVFTPIGRGARRESSLRGGRLVAEPGQCFLRRLLLGRLLRLPRPDTQLLALDHGGAAKAPVVRRAGDVEHRVVDGLPSTGKRLLQLGLVVDV